MPIKPANLTLVIAFWVAAADCTLAKTRQCDPFYVLYVKDIFDYLKNQSIPFPFWLV